MRLAITLLISLLFVGPAYAWHTGQPHYPWAKSNEADDAYRQQELIRQQNRQLQEIQEQLEEMNRKQRLWERQRQLDEQRRQVDEMQRGLR